MAAKKNGKKPAAKVSKQKGMPLATSEPAAVWVDRSKLSPWDRNPRRNDQAVNAVANSIERFGFGAPIVARKNGTVIAGHTRLKAAEVLKMDKVPVRYLDVSEKEAKLLALADNKLGEIAEWDVPILLDELKGFDLPDIELSGWSEKDLSELATKFMNDSAETMEDEFDVSKADEAQTKWKVKLGDIWQLGEHRIACGDCQNEEILELLMSGSKAALVVTDPPYGVSYAAKNEFLNAVSRGNHIQTPIENDHMKATDMSEFWKTTWSTLRPHLSNSAAYYMTGPQGGDLLLLLLSLQDSGWPLRHMLVWAKNNHVLGRCDYHYKHEPILYGWFDRHEWFGDSSETSLWEINKPQKSELHPTMKPVELYSRAIRNSSAKDSIVLEPFSGSGTCIVACEQLQRRCRAVELSPAYVAVALERFEILFGKTPTLTN